MAHDVMADLPSAGGRSAAQRSVARIFEECTVRLKRDWDNPRMRKLLYRGMQVLWPVAGTASLVVLTIYVLYSQFLC
ncbi:MAG: hypothetical protein ACLGJC_14515 [Alphaproteobacteria bacterium]